MAEHPCGKCRFYDQSLWQPVTDKAVATLNRSFARRELSKGSVLYHQGDSANGVYCVSQGLIALRSFGVDGSSMLLRLAYPGDLIGYRAFVTGRQHRTEAQALVPSRVCVVAQRDAKQVVQACPAVLARLAERCADELGECQQRIHEAARLTNTTRLERLLQKLMTAHGVQQDGVWRMRLPLSRQDMADILGVQPETLSRLLTKLETQGIVHSSGRWIEMPVLHKRDAA